MTHSVWRTAAGSCGGRWAERLGSEGWPSSSWHQPADMKLNAFLSRAVAMGKAISLPGSSPPHLQNGGMSSLMALFKDLNKSHCW